MVHSRSLRLSQRAAVLLAHRTPEGVVDYALDVSVLSFAAHGVSASLQYDIPITAESFGEEPPTAVGYFKLLNEIVSAEGFMQFGTAGIECPVTASGAGVAAVFGTSELLLQVITETVGASSVAGSITIEIPLYIESEASAGFDGMAHGTASFSLPAEVSAGGLAAVSGMGEAPLRIQAAAVGSVGTAGVGEIRVGVSITARANRGNTGAGAAAIRPVVSASGVRGNGAEIDFLLAPSISASGVIRDVFSAIGGIVLTPHVVGQGTAQMRSGAADTLFVRTQSNRVDVVSAL